MSAPLALRRAHPINMLALLPRFSFLLLLPLTRSALTVFTGGFRQWIAGAWMDVLTLGAVLALTWLRWISISYRYSDEGILYRQGLFKRQSVFIPAENICTVSMVAHFFFRPINVVELRADTAAGRPKKMDFTLLIPTDEAGAILAQRYDASERAARTYRPNTASVLMLSLLTSNSLAGILLIATFISQLGEVAGRQLSRYFVDTLNHVGRALAFGIPPAAAALGYFMLFCWAVAFSAAYLRNKNFVVSSGTRALTLSHGLLTRRSYSVALGSISFVDIRETVFSRLFGLCAVFVHAVGFGAKQRDVSALIPAVRFRSAQDRLRELLPDLGPLPRTAKPNAGALLRFIGDPIGFALAILAGWLAAVRFYPEWRVFCSFVAVMAMAPTCWFFAIRLLDYLSSGAAHEGGKYVLRYSEGFYLHTVVIPQDKVIIASSRQSVLQKLDNRCDLIIYTYGQRVTRHRCRNLDLDEVHALIGI